MSPGEHQTPLRPLGLGDEAAQRLGIYLDLLARWAGRTNLTAARSASERVAVLVAPVLAGLPWIRPGRLIDVGSGNGSPGLVLAVLRPDLEVTLLEPRLRRWAFLREAARSLGRPEIDVRRERLEDYDGPPFRTVTLRAVTLAADRVARLLEPGGRVLVWGRPLGGQGTELVALAHGQDPLVYERVPRETRGSQPDS